MDTLSPRGKYQLLGQHNSCTFLIDISQVTFPAFLYVFLAERRKKSVFLRHSYGFIRNVYTIGKNKSLLKSRSVLNSTSIPDCVELEMSFTILAQ